MSLPRRRPQQGFTYGWVAVGLAAALTLGSVLPGAGLLGDGGLAEKVLTDQNCRLFLRLGVPLLGAQLATGVAEPPDAAAGQGREGGLVAWVFEILTGVSLGQPTSFLTANLPLARSSYAGEILASGWRATTGTPTARAGDGGQPSAVTGGGLNPGQPGAGSRPPAWMGVPGEDSVMDEAGGQFRIFGSGDPVIAIVHTHTSESYLPVVTALAQAADPAVDTSTLEAFSTDSSVNMLRVGEELGRYLATTHGVTVVQCRRFHDLERDGFRLGAYERSLESMTALLRNYPTVSILLDLHRDAPPREKTTVVTNGVSMASIYVIVGTDQLLDNPHWEDNYDFARRLVAVMEQSYPGLSRGILVRDERYNQHVMARTILLEIGGQANTLEEVFASTHAVGEVLAQILAGGLD